MLRRAAALTVAVLLAGCAGAPSTSDGGWDAGAPDAGEACWSSSVSDCAASGCRVISGRRSTDAGASWSGLPFLPAGCKPAGELCGTTISYGHPPDAGGECWEFTDTCLPRGWTRTTYPACPSTR